MATKHVSSFLSILLGLIGLVFVVVLTQRSGSAQESASTAILISPETPAASECDMTPISIDVVLARVRAIFAESDSPPAGSSSIIIQSTVQPNYTLRTDVEIDGDPWIEKGVLLKK